MLIGYARVSTEDQDPALQETALREYGCERIYVDHASGKDMNRKEWKRCNRDLRDGDTLVVWRLDRLARSVLALHTVAKDFKERGVSLVILKENIDTRTSSGRLLYTLSGAFAEFEREVISERTKAGIDQAKTERGFLPGDLPAITEKLWPVAVGVVRDFAERGETLTNYKLHQEMSARGSKVTQATWAKWRERLDDAAKPGADASYPADWKAKYDQHRRYQREKKRAARKA